MLSSFFIFPVSLLKFSLSSYTLPLSSLRILITSLLKAASGKLLVSTLLSSFLEFCSVLSLGTCLFVSSLYPPPCVCFYVLGRGAISPMVGRVAFCSRYSVGPSGIASLITQAEHLRYVPPPHHVGCTASCCS